MERSSAKLLPALAAGKSMHARSGCSPCVCATLTRRETGLKSQVCTSKQFCSDLAAPGSCAVAGLCSSTQSLLFVLKPALVSLSSLSSRRSQVIEKFEALDIENAEHMETNVSAGAALSSETRQGRSEKRVFPRKRVSCGPRCRGGTPKPRVWGLAVGFLPPAGARWARARGRWLQSLRVCCSLLCAPGPAADQSRKSGCLFSFLQNRKRDTSDLARQDATVWREITKETGDLESPSCA